MSNLLYPLGLIANLEVEKIDRVLADDFTDGSAQTRSAWPVGYFKRRFTLTHAPLTAYEFDFLKSFYRAVGGTYDTFTFRDNVHREGNATVRFSKPLKHTRSGSAYIVQVEMIEAAPVAIPSPVDVASLAGRRPLLWWDANRATYYQHCGQTQFPPLDNSGTGDYKLSWLKTLGTTNDMTFPSGVPEVIGSLGPAADYFQFTGKFFGQALASIPDLALANSPNFTLFLLARQSTPSIYSSMLSLGDPSLSVGSITSIILTADNKVRPDNNDATDWSLDTQLNSVDVWRCWAITCANGGPVRFYYPHSGGTVPFATNPQITNPLARLGAFRYDDYILNPGNTQAHSYIAHPMIFDTCLTLSQLTALATALGAPYGASI